MATGDVFVFSEKIDPRPAIVLEGVDDFIQVDAWATDRQTAADTVGTITAWVMPEAKDASYTIIAAGDVSADEFIDFAIISGKLSIVVSDAATTDLDVVSTNVVVLPHVWTHVAVVQDSNRPTLYVNGVAVAMTDTTSLDLTSWFDQMSALDAGNIGVLDANSTTTQDFAGAIGQVRHWNAALSSAEILKDFEGGGEAISTAVDALQVSNWDWDGLTDKWVGANNGTVVSAAVLDASYTPMTSQLKTAVTLVGDALTMSTSNGVMSAIVVKA